MRLSPIPTETVYGLGALATSEVAIKRVYEVKGRPSDNPLIVHVHKDYDISSLVEVEKGVDGLVHVSQISNEWLENPVTALQVGQEVDAKIIDINIEKEKMTLSIKALQPVPEGLERPARAKKEKEANAEKPVRETFKRLGSIFAEFKKNRKALIFLVAFFFYIDGVHTIIKMATALGTDLGFDQVKLVIMLFVTQFVAFPCALIFGKLSKKFSCEKMLLVAISAYTAIGVFTVFLTYEWQCWILVVSVGMFQGGVQAMSRSYFTKLIPSDKTGEFFGIYDIFGKSAAILGLGLTGLLGIFFPLSEANGFNVSLLPLPVLFAIGLVLFLHWL